MTDNYGKVSARWIGGAVPHYTVKCLANLCLGKRAEKRAPMFSSSWVWEEHGSLVLEYRKTM